MREYEVTVVLKTDLDDDARNALIEQIAGRLNPSGEEATAPKINHWGSGPGLSHSERAGWLLRPVRSDR